MAAETKTFSESWYRIAGQRLALRSHVRVQRQIFRGERYYVLHDPYTNQFFRLRPEAYAFIGRLRLDQTVETIWRDCLEKQPEEAPGQEDVLQLLAQLHGANLLHSNLSPDSAKLFERFKKRRQREVKGAVANLMYARLPLLDPSAWLNRLEPLLRRIISPAGALVWLVVVGFAVKLAADHAGELLAGPDTLLAPANLPLLYLGMLLLKLFHEFGHAAMCRRFGGEVHVFGVMLAFLTPMPYVDTTSSWSFRSRWPRALVGAGGMIAELLVAAGAVFVWANTGEGTLHGLAYNMMFAASVSTLLFNANPLLRFDGYYILSDVLEIPNLQARAGEQLRHWVERYLFGNRKSHGPALAAGEAFWLACYGVLSRIYRVFLFAGIVLFLSERYLIVGVLMALACLFSWLVKPAWQLVHYLAFSPRLARRRGRAVAVVAGAFGFVTVLFGVIPAPDHFRAPGVVEAVEHTLVSAETVGRVEKILTPSGSRVQKGQALVELADPETLLQVAGVRAQLAETNALRQRALDHDIAELKAIVSRTQAIEKQLRRYEQQKSALTVRAPHNGIWFAPELRHSLGSYVVRGTELGQLVNPSAFRFSAVVSENDAPRLFEGTQRPAEVRLYGQTGVALKVTGQRIIPADQTVLPSAALGWRSGGDVAVFAADRGGVRTREPFFAVQGTLEPQPGVVLLHGWTGRIRFALPPQPLLWQWKRQLTQLLQKRYGL